VDDDPALWPSVLDRRQGRVLVQGVGPSRRVGAEPAGVGGERAHDIGLGAEAEQLEGGPVGAGDPTATVIGDQCTREVVELGEGCQLALVHEWKSGRRDVEKRVVEDG